MTGNPTTGVPLRTEHDYETEREHCSLLKTQIVSCMTDEVRIKITSKGYTPTEIATVYILRKYNFPDDDYRVVDTHNLNIKDDMGVPNYQDIIFDVSGTAIVDIIF